MKRKIPVLTLCALLAALCASADAQQAMKIPRIGVLDNTTASGSAVLLEAFWQEVRKLGWIEGKNITIEYRFAEQKNERLPELAADLVRLKVDLIVTAGSPPASAAKKATTSIPIVMANVGDPVGAGLVASLARPGGSATGLSCIHSDLAGKRIGILRELIPSVQKVAVVFNPSDPNKRLEFLQIKRASELLSVAAHDFEIPTAESIEIVFSAISREQFDAVVLLVDAFTIFHRKKLADLALNAKIPMASGFKEFAEAGALVTYGANRSVLFKRAATYVDKIIKGAKPGELPVEEPRIFELYINGKVAKALDIPIPNTLYVQADRILE